MVPIYFLFCISSLPQSYSDFKPYQKHPCYRFYRNMFGKSFVFLLFLFLFLTFPLKSIVLYVKLKKKKTNQFYR